MFDAVLENRLTLLADVVPFTPRDLPGYAGGLFDALVADPGLLRLTVWKGLERPGPSPLERDAHIAKAAEIAEVYGVDVGTGMDVLMMLIVGAQAWGMTAPEIRNAGGDEGTRRCGYRATMVRAVDALVAELLEREAP